MININGVMIIPTGLGCLQGGDAAFNPGVKLISQCCNRLIINPNAINASDVNEMPSNCLYTEGSTIDRFLEGEINLQEIKIYNKILCVVNSPACHANRNAVNAGIWGLGADITLLELTTPLIMTACINEDGTAGGTVIGWETLVEQVTDLDYDVLAIHTPIDCPPEIANNYWKNGGVNPWGRCEAVLSKLLSAALNKQAVHAPVEFLETPLYNSLTVKQSMAPEIISTTYAFCIFKGLHHAPIIDITCNQNNISNKDIDFLVSPMNCWGRPHEACKNNNIPIIIVKENTTCLKNIIYPDYKSIIFVENYLEAAGVIMCMNAGINYKTIIL